MIQFLELMFYVTYLSFKNKDKRKNKEDYEISFVGGAILSLSVTGALFLFGVLLLFGIIFDIGVFMFLISYREYGSPFIFLTIFASGLFFYRLCVRGGKYVKYKKKYPEFTTENIPKYHKQYMMWPVVTCILLFFLSVWLTFETGRGI